MIKTMLKKLIKRPIWEGFQGVNQPQSCVLFLCSPSKAAEPLFPHLLSYAFSIKFVNMTRCYQTLPVFKWITVDLQITLGKSLLSVQTIVDKKPLISCSPLKVLGNKISTFAARVCPKGRLRKPDLKGKRRKEKEGVQANPVAYF